jgi:hypothetical protein
MLGAVTVRAGYVGPSTTRLPSRIEEVAPRLPLVVTPDSARIVPAALTPSVSHGPFTVRSLPLPLIGVVATSVVAVSDFDEGSDPPFPSRMGVVASREIASAAVMLFITVMLGATTASHVVPNEMGLPDERSMRAMERTLLRETDTGVMYGSSPPATLTVTGPVSSRISMRSSGTVFPSIERPYVAEGVGSA